MLSACATKKVVTTTQTVGSTGTRYDNYLSEGEVKVASNYQQILSKRGNHFVKRIYFPESEQLTHYGEYLNRSLATPDGPYQEWYDNGNLWKSGQYTNGLLSGEWNHYHPNGQLNQVGKYINDQATGLWKTFHKDGKPNSSGEYENGLKVGEWTSRWPNGQLKEVAHFATGDLDGEVLNYDSLGNATPTEYYKSGQLTDVNGLPAEPSAKNEKMPFFKGCEAIINQEEYRSCSQKKLMEFIYSNVKYPSRAIVNEVEGQAIVSFVVEKDGSIQEIKVLRGINRDIQAEVLRIINLMPKWHPGELNGEPVRVQFSLPVKFKLE